MRALVLCFSALLAPLKPRLVWAGIVKVTDVDFCGSHSLDAGEYYFETCIRDSNFSLQRVSAFVYFVIIPLKERCTPGFIALMFGVIKHS